MFEVGTRVETVEDLGGGWGPVAGTLCEVVNVRADRKVVWVKIVEKDGSLGKGIYWTEATQIKSVDHLCYRETGIACKPGTCGHCGSNKKAVTEIAQTLWQVKFTSRSDMIVTAATLLDVADHVRGWCKDNNTPLRDVTAIKYLAY